MSAKSLHEASVDAAISGLKHIVISITPEGELVACGSSELEEAMIYDPTSKESLLETFSSSVDPALKQFVSTQVPSYRKLPLPASSPQFTGSKLLRSTLANLLFDAGYGGKGRRIHGKFQS